MVTPAPALFTTEEKYCFVLDDLVIYLGNKIIIIITEHL